MTQDNLYSSLIMTPEDLTPTLDTDTVTDSSKQGAHVITPSAPPDQRFWVNDTSLSTIADLISNQLQQDKQETVQQPQPTSDPIVQQAPHQHLCVRHQNNTTPP
jgi:hypothetical protein